MFSVSIFNMLRRTVLLLLVAATAARRLSPSPVVPASKERSNKKKVLMLISDTGGGHRASAHALEAARCVEAVLLRACPVVRGLSAASDPWPLAWPHRRPRTPAPAQAMHRFVKTRRALGPPAHTHALAERTAPHGTQAAMLKETADVEVKVVDIWTEYGRFPWNKMAAGYPFCCKHPIVWKAMFYTTIGT